MLLEHPDDVDAVAATVVLLRDTAPGPEVLLLERPDRGVFAGAWVFPGGALEDVDVPDTDLTPGDPADEERAARRAGVRETFEETALIVDPDDLTHFARWYPPRETPKRFRTWFYAARAPEQQIVLQPEEAVRSEWMRPAHALEQHERGELSLLPPTWVTLLGFSSDASVDEALDRVAREPARVYEGRLALDSRVLVWADDVAYPDDVAFEAAGPRHRLRMSGRPWVYESDL